MVEGTVLSNLRVHISGVTKCVTKFLTLSKLKKPLTTMLWASKDSLRLPDWHPRGSWVDPGSPGPRKYNGIIFPEAIMMIIMMCAAFERRHSTDQVGIGEGKGAQEKNSYSQISSKHFSFVRQGGSEGGKGGRFFPFFERHQMCFNKHIQGLHQLFLKAHSSIPTLIPYSP